MYNSIKTISTITPTILPFKMIVPNGDFLANKEMCFVIKLTYKDDNGSFNTGQIPQLSKH